jgi:cytochrome c oxidase subunit 3
MSELAVAPQRLPFGSVGKTGTGWWGVLCLIAAEACLFGYLLFSYAFTAINAGPGWMPAKPPELTLAVPDTLLLLASSVAAWWGERGIKQGKRRQLALGYGAAIVMGAVFVGVQVEEWREKTYRLSTSGYASHYFTITGFHMAHVVVGLLGLGLMLVWNGLGYFDKERHAPVLFVSLYWHFVDAVWLFVFAAFYVAPRMGLA